MRRLLAMAALVAAPVAQAAMSAKEIDACYEQPTAECIQHLSTAKVTVQVEPWTPLYAEPSKAARIVDQVKTAPFKWQCYPPETGAEWMRCARDEYIYIGPK